MSEHPLVKAPTSTRAAGFVAKAMTHTKPSERRELLTAMMAHAAKGLAVIDGREGAAEAVYLLADEMVVRGAV